MKLATIGAFVPSSLFVLSVLVCSCQRDVDDPEPPVIPPPVVVGTVDSTQLIKSITLIYDGENPGEVDSTIETYQYDTVNHKIRLTWEDNLGYWFFGTNAEISYNDKRLATGIQYTYPVGYPTTSEDYQSIAVSYDAADILNKVTVRYTDGHSDEIPFTKTLLDAGKYELEWTVGENYDEHRKASFDATGRNILNSWEYSHVIVTDSMAYDGVGNINKIFRTIVDTLLHSKEQYVDYEFTGRMSKGDQLYKQRQLLLNGFGNIIFTDPDDFINDAFGVLSVSLDGESVQYCRYPAQSVKVRFDPAEIKNFTVGAEFDTSDRLTKFKWFERDLDLVPETYIIKYYK